MAVAGRTGFRSAPRSYGRFAASKLAVEAEPASDTFAGDTGPPAVGPVEMIGAVAGIERPLGLVESGMIAVRPIAVAVTAATATLEASLWVQSASKERPSLD